MDWKEITEERYWAMHTLPSGMILSIGHKIIVIEPMYYRVCSITGEVRPAYDALIAYKGKWGESIKPITIPEFRELTPDW